MKARMYNFSSWIEETEPSKIEQRFEKLLRESGFNVENVVKKHFEPFGYTALYLLSESHFAVHTFPEENTTYIELSSCVEEPFNAFISGLN